MIRKMLMISIAVMLLISANPSVTRMAKLTVINKSGLPVELELTGTDPVQNNWYYLRIPVGDRLYPTEKIYSIALDTYQAVAYYIEPWDPVYGYDCGSKSSRVAATKNIKVTILECTRSVRHGGEPAIVKLGAGGR